MEACCRIEDARSRYPRLRKASASASGFAGAIALLFLMAFARSAFAQTAPAGNAHPTPQAVTKAEGDLTNPFGDPDWSTHDQTDDARRAAAEAKARLERSIDIEPLRDLAVFHSGRVKILDTLARETVRRITGRSKYEEVRVVEVPTKTVIKAPPEEPQAVLEHSGSFDPLFTYLDLLIDPAHYLDRPLVHVEYLPLRRAMIEQAMPKKPHLQNAALRLTRLSPRIVSVFGPPLENQHGFKEPYARAFNSIRLAMDLYQNSYLNLLMVAPPSSEQPYHHLSTLPEDSPARRAALELGRAWRAGDAAGVTAAAGALASELPRINGANYPTTSRELELTYNRVNAFEWGYWVYGLAFLSLILAFGTERRWLTAVGHGTLMAAVALHAFGFIARCFIAERFAIQNQFESMTGLSLFANVVGVAIMLLKRQWLFGAAAAGVGFLVLITATQTGIPGVFIEREAAILNTSVLLKYHVTTVLSSYGLISLGFIISLFYLFTHYGAKWRAVPGAPLTGAAVSEPVAVAASALNLGPGEQAGPSRTLHDLDRAQMTVLQLAFWTLGVGILLGAWWADHSWGRWWAFDPKETWALITWIVYLVVIHLRVAGGRFDRGLVSAWMSVLGFVVMCWTYFGVNLLLPGLHAYA